MHPVAFAFFGRKLLFDFSKRVAAESAYGNDGTVKAMLEIVEKLNFEAFVSLKKIDKKAYETKISEFPAIARKEMEEIVEFASSGLEALDESAYDVGPNIVSATETETGAEKGRKRKNEGESEREKKRRKLNETLEHVVAFVPEDLWVDIFKLIPDARSLLGSTMAVNVAWCAMTKKVVASKNPNALIRRNGVLSNFSDSIVSLDLSYDDEIDDKTLRVFSSLTKLNLHQNRKITDDALSILTSLTELTAGDEISDDGLKELTNLTKLKLSRLNGDNQINAPFNSLVNVTYLTLGTSSNLEVNDISNLVNLKTLKDYDSDNIWNATWHTIGDTLMTLRSQNPCWLESQKDGDGPLDYGSGKKYLTNLTKLKLTGKAASEVGDADIKNMTNLTELAVLAPLRSNRLTDGAFENLTNLKTLVIRNNRTIVGEFLNRLTGLTKLSLEKAYRLLFDDSMLKKMTALTELKFDGHFIGAGNELGRALFVNNAFENLTSLDIASSTSGPDDISASLVVAGRLVKLCVSTDDYTVSHLSKFTNLTDLRIYAVDEIDVPPREDGKSHWEVGLEPLRKLKKFYIKNTEETENPNLTKIDLFGKILNEILTTVTDLGVSNSPVLDDASVSGLTHLKRLKLTDCPKVTGKSLGRLVNLERLSWRFSAPREGDADENHAIHSYVTRLTSLVRLIDLDMGTYPSTMRSFVEKSIVVGALINLNNISRYRLVRGDDTRIVGH